MEMFPKYSEYARQAHANPIEDADMVAGPVSINQPKALFSTLPPVPAPSERPPSCNCAMEELIIAEIYSKGRRVQRLEAVEKEGLTLLGHFQAERRELIVDIQNLISALSKQAEVLGSIITMIPGTYQKWEKTKEAVEYFGWWSEDRIREVNEVVSSPPVQKAGRDCGWTGHAYPTTRDDSRAYQGLTGVASTPQYGHTLERWSERHGIKITGAKPTETAQHAVETGQANSTPWDDFSSYPTPAAVASTVHYGQAPVGGSDVYANYPAPTPSQPVETEMQIAAYTPRPTSPEIVYDSIARSVDYDEYLDAPKPKRVVASRPEVYFRDIQWNSEKRLKQEERLGSRLEKGDTVDEAMPWHSSDQAATGFSRIVGYERGRTSSREPTAEAK